MVAGPCVACRQHLGFGAHGSDAGQSSALSCAQSAAQSSSPAPAHGLHSCLWHFARGACDVWSAGGAQTRRQQGASDRRLLQVSSRLPLQPTCLLLSLSLSACLSVCSPELCSLSLSSEEREVVHQHLVGLWPRHVLNVTARATQVGRAFTNGHGVSGQGGLQGV